MTNFDREGFQRKLLSQNIDKAELKAELWAYQLAHNPVIQTYCHHLGETNPVSVPISFFKEFMFKTGQNWEPEMIFASSGTTGQVPSRHFVREAGWYRKNVLHGFRAFFEEEPYRILALLPSYLERGNSSLVYMVKTWMDEFGLPESGFYLDDFVALRKAIHEGIAAGERLLLIGVAFALLDFAEDVPIHLPPDSIVIETGGMKGRKKELVRWELHDRLRQGLHVEPVYSEYGMTELMSQAYTGKDGRFRPAPTMEVWVSDIHLNRLDERPGISGRLHIVDLANIDSCAFIATDDIGRMHEDGSFEVLGRLDHAEMRGCSLMYV